MELGIKPDRVVSYKDIVEYDRNPFLEHLNINSTTTLKRVKKDKLINNEDNSISKKEVKEISKNNDELKQVGLEIGIVKTKQMADFVLIYLPFPYSRISEIGFKIFFYLLENRINLGSDAVVFSMDELCKGLETTRPTVSRGIVDLVNNNIICKQLENVWWINPNYFYAGNRLKIKTK